MPLDGEVDVDESASPAMTQGSMRAWLWPTLGAALFMAGTAGVVYKIIGGYRHAAPDAFISVQDQNKVPAPSGAAGPSAASADAAASPGSTATAAPAVAAAPAAAAPAAAAPAAPSRVPRDAKDFASSTALESDPSTDAQNDSCAAIKTEQHEIEGALNKKYSSEEGSYLKRRLRELTEQSVKQKCGE